MEKVDDVRVELKSFLLVFSLALSVNWYLHGFSFERMNGRISDRTEGNRGTE